MGGWLERWEAAALERHISFSEDCTKEFYFKASFDKANRTSLNSYRGLGVDEGLGC